MPRPIAVPTTKPKPPPCQPPPCQPPPPPPPPPANAEVGAKVAALSAAAVERAKIVLRNMGRLLLVCACSSRSRKWVTTPPFPVHAAASENRAGNALPIESIEELSVRIRHGRDPCHTLRRAFRALAGTVSEGYKPARFHGVSAALS